MRHRKELTRVHDETALLHAVRRLLAVDLVTWVALSSQANPIAFVDSPEPVLIEIDLACRLCNRIGRSVNSA